MIKLLIILALIIIAKYYKDNYKLLLKEIDFLHINCENYLKILKDEELIPKEIADNIIQKMNENYGEIELCVQKK